MEAVDAAFRAQHGGGRVHVRVRGCRFEDVNVWTKEGDIKPWVRVCRSAFVGMHWCCCACVCAWVFISVCVSVCV